MEITIVQADFGVVYFIFYEGFIRECTLKSVVYDILSTTEEMVLDIAGVGEARIALKRDKYKYDEEYDKIYYTVIADTVEHLNNHKYIPFRIIDTSNKNHFDELKGMIPYLSFDEYDDYYMYKFDKNKGVVRASPKWNYWRYDEYGFDTDIAKDSYYTTEDECRNANMTQVITF